MEKQIVDVHIKGGKRNIIYQYFLASSSERTDLDEIHKTLDKIRRYGMKKGMLSSEAQVYLLVNTDT